MVNVRLGKMPQKTKHFNKNQKVWLKMMTGDQAVLCVGKFRGRGRYVEAWVKWDNKKTLMPKWKTIQISDDFAIKHGLDYELTQAKE